MFVGLHCATVTLARGWEDGRIISKWGPGAGLTVMMVESDDSHGMEYKAIKNSYTALGLLGAFNYTKKLKKIYRIINI